MNLPRPSVRPSFAAKRFSRPRSALASALLAPGVALGIALGLPLAAADELPTRTDARLVNERTVGIAFHPEDAYRRLVGDMTDTVLDADVRLVPIIGFNHAQTIYDMLYMEGVDLGIVQADVFEYMAQEQGELLVTRRIGAFAELFGEKIAIIANERYAALAELDGRKVNFQAPGEGTDITGAVLFEAADIEVEPTRFDAAEALAKVRTGEIDAMVHLVDEPAEAFANLSRADGVRLLALPQTEPLLERYRAAELTGEEFPGLIDEGAAVPSLEVSTILAAYNWPESRPARFGKVTRFAESMVDNLDALKGGGEAAARWESVSLSSEVPGTSRSQIAEAVLEGRLESLRTRQQALVEMLAERLESGDAGVPELERLIEQLQATLDN